MNWLKRDEGEELEKNEFNAEGWKRERTRRGMNWVNRNEREGNRRGMNWIKRDEIEELDRDELKNEKWNKEFERDKLNIKRYERE